MHDSNMFISIIKEEILAYVDDVKRNRANIKMLLALLSYRMAHVASRHRKLYKLSNVYAVPMILLHRFLTEWLFGMDLPAATTIGRGLIIDHGYAIVINKNTHIGSFCRIRHSVTIGCKLNPDGSQGPSPRIGSYVDIGAGAIIIGDVCIGDRAIIGAGSVVVNDVKPYQIVAGNPAKVIRTRESV